MESSFGKEIISIQWEKKPQMRIAHNITAVDNINAYFGNEIKMVILSVLWSKKKMVPGVRVWGCVCVCA